MCVLPKNKDVGLKLIYQIFVFEFNSEFVHRNLNIQNPRVEK